MKDLRTNNHKLRRVTRLLQIIQEIRANPRQELGDFLERLSISRTQFYKDRKVLCQLGFHFSYKKGKGFTIVEDRLSPSGDLTLSERIILMFALRSLSTTGDGHLVAAALSLAKKLVGDIPDPLRNQIVSEFDRVVIRESFGCKPEVLSTLEKAVVSRERIFLHYNHPEKAKEIYDVEPYHLYFLRRALYLYAFSYKDKDYRTFRVSRISKVVLTGIGFTSRPDIRFHEKLSNAFSAFLGEKREKVSVRFSPAVKPYIEEVCWHHSQKIIPFEDGSILFQVEVAEPREVMWWAFQWGANAEILEPDWLREKALRTAYKMLKKYGGKQHRLLESGESISK